MTWRCNTLAFWRHHQGFFFIRIFLLYRFPFLASCVPSFPTIQSVILHFLLNSFWGSYQSSCPAWVPRVRHVSSWESLVPVKCVLLRTPCPCDWSLPDSASYGLNTVLYRLICVSLWWVLTSSWKLLHHFFLLAFMWFPPGIELEWVLVFSTDCTSRVPHQLLLTGILASHQRPHFQSLPSGGKSLIRRVPPFSQGSHVHPVTGFLHLMADFV